MSLFGLFFSSVFSVLGHCILVKSFPSRCKNVCFFFRRVWVLKTVVGGEGRRGSDLRGRGIQMGYSI